MSTRAIDRQIVFSLNTTVAMTRICLFIVCTVLWGEFIVPLSCGVSIKYNLVAKEIVECHLQRTKLLLWESGIEYF